MKERTKLPPIVASPQTHTHHPNAAYRLAEDRVAPVYENQLDLPSYLEKIAADMRAGEISPVSEACLLFKDMANEDPSFITVLRWGEDDGMMDHDTVAALGGRVGPVQ